MEKQEEEMHQHVRRRPGMYIGSLGLKGVNYLITHIFEELVKGRDAKVESFAITILGNTVCSLQVRSNHDLQQFLRLFLYDYSKPFTAMFCKALRGLTSRLEINTSQAGFVFNYGIISEDLKGVNKPSDGVLLIRLELDIEIFKELKFDFYYLRNCIEEFALLNKDMKFYIEDKRYEVVNQNYFHFPNGIMHKMNWVCSDIYSTGYHQITICTQMDSNYYQIAIAWPSDWMYRRGRKISYAGNYITSENGSLIDGVMKGIYKALKKYAQDVRPDFEISFSQFKKNDKLSIVAQVKSDELEFAGSTKDKLESGKIKSEATVIAMGMLSDYFRDNRRLPVEMLSWSRK